MTKVHEPEVIIEKTRMTIEYLMETYSRIELMRLFKFQMINNIQVLEKDEIERVLALSDDAPELQRPDRDSITNKANKLMDLLEEGEDKGKQLNRIESAIDSLTDKLDK